MRNVFILVLCATVPALFFACSNDGLKIEAPEAEQNRISCEWDNRRDEISRDICFASGGKEASDPQPSSSSDGPVGPPKPDPRAAGQFYFKFLDKDDPPTYFLSNAAKNMRLTSNSSGLIESSGKIYTNLTLTNATESGCGSIQYKLTLNDFLLPGQDKLTGETGGVTVNSTGSLAVTAYANCGGVDKTLKNAEGKDFIITAEVKDPPPTTCEEIGGETTCE